ncbi:MAG TPA: penicillin-binding protein activator [Syntrophales bacterium]|nr:penicillin-binding protein activator [Syntrophales bacterium]
MQITRMIAAASCLTALILSGPLESADRPAPTPSPDAYHGNGPAGTPPAAVLVDRNAIGCILPLSGRYAAYGKKALDAAVLAAGLFDPRKPAKAKLIIEDSEGDPDASRRAVARLVQRDGVICVIGPLGAVEAQTAAAEAQRLEVPILAMTSREGIAEIGPFVFRNFLTARMQVRALAGYAVQKLGLSRFAVLYPQDAYGQEMARLFRAEVLRLGGQMHKVKAYDRMETDFGDEIRFLTGRPVPHSIGFGKDQRTEPLPAARPVDFDALFIPDSFERVQMIAPQLAFHDVKGVQLLGTSGWNSPDLLKGGAPHLEGAVFVDDYFAGGFNPELNDFTDSFYAAFGREPDGMEAVWFDAAAIAVSIIENGRAETRDQFRGRLAGMTGYPGVTGKTSFTPSRDADKELYLLRVQEGQIVQIR